MVNAEMLVVLRAVGSQNFADSVWLKSWIFSHVASACTDAHLLIGQEAPLPTWQLAAKGKFASMGFMWMSNSKNLLSPSNILRHCRKGMQ